MATRDEQAELNMNLVKKLARCNYQYGHILVCCAQGRITDEVALGKRFDALEKKIQGMVDELDLTDSLEVEFNRKQVPPANLFLTEPPFTHLPYFPLKFLLGGRDVSSTFQIHLEDDQ